MNWKKEAINDLRAYEGRKQSLKNIREKYQALEYSYGAIKSSLSNSTPVQGGGSRTEDVLIANICERERLVLTYRATRKLVRLTERGLADLDSRQRRVLELFFINRSDHHIDQLMNEFGIEKTHVYRIKDEALHAFTTAMYGISEY